LITYIIAWLSGLVPLALAHVARRRWLRVLLSVASGLYFSFGALFSFMAWAMDEKAKGFGYLWLAAVHALSAAVSYFCVAVFARRSA